MYNLAFKLKIVAEAEAVENNSEIAREYGISESMVRRWRKDQANLFNGELKMSAKRMMTGPFEFTPAGKKKAPSRNLVLRWIKQSWAEIPAEMVRKSFKTCGISNALDGTEDDEVYADDMPELADDNMAAMEDEFETDSEEDDD